MKFCLVLIYLISSNAVALKTSIERSETSDNIEASILNINKEIKKYNAKAKFKYINGSISNNDLNVYSLSADKNFDLKNKIKINTNLTSSKLETKTVSKARLSGNIKLAHEIEELQYSINFGKYYLINDFLINDASAYLLSITKAQLNYSYTFQDVWKLKGFANRSKHSDTNVSKKYDLSLMYGISPAWPWIWLGYGVNIIKHEQDKIGYWSPTNFSAHGPRFESNFGVYKKLSAILALNVSFYNEDGTKGTSHYAVAGLQWGNYNKRHFKLTYNRIKSGQDNSPWTSDHFSLTCNIPDLF
jgi:hypothetical protein